MKHLGTLLRLTVSVDELKAHDPRLRELNTWFRNSSLVSSMGIQAYCEKQAVVEFVVVSETSADPGLQGVESDPGRRERRLDLQARLPREAGLLADQESSSQTGAALDQRASWSARLAGDWRLSAPTASEQSPAASHPPGT